ncbi:MAG: BamA/TamA family outer membrane protein [Proteobacteria bacterium]|nr:BamA/TamA family outer membrane protein [Pseudomonadota bacterium]
MPQIVPRNIWQSIGFMGAMFVAVGSWAATDIVTTAPKVSNGVEFNLLFLASDDEVLALGRVAGWSVEGRPAKRKELTQDQRVASLNTPLPAAPSHFVENETKGKLAGLGKDEKKKRPAKEAESAVDEIRKETEKRAIQAKEKSAEEGEEAAEKAEEDLEKVETEERAAAEEKDKTDTENKKNENGIVLSAVVIEGATAYQLEEFAPLYEKYLGKTVSGVELRNVAESITKKYKADGYFLSRAFMPRQRITLGIVRYQIFEGFIESVEFAGAMRGRDSLLRAYGDNIAADRPLRKWVFVNNLVLVNSLPGVEATPTLTPVEGKPDAFQLVLELAHQTYDGSVTVDNRGTRSIGPYRSLFGVALNSILGQYEQTSLSFITAPLQPEELLYYEVGHRQPIGEAGTTITFSAARTNVDAGADLSDLAVNSFKSGLSLKIDHPLYRRSDQSASLSLRFDYSNSNTTKQAETLTEDRLRVLRIGGRYNISDDFEGKNSVGVKLSQGLNILGATTAGSATLSQFGGKSSFTKIEATAERQQSLSDALSLRASTHGQWSEDRLLSAEKFSIGGSQFGRAYDAAEISGMNGVASSLQLAYQYEVDAEYLQAFSLYGFYDFGVVWDSDIDEGNTSESLASAGIGLTLNLPSDVFVRLEIAKPLTRTVAQLEENGKNPRLFLTISMQY